jgi:hypothetical protein
MKPHESRASLESTSKKSYVRAGVEMKAYESCARNVTDSFLKLEASLTHELARS